MTIILIVSLIANIIAVALWQVTRNELTQWRLLYSQQEHFLEDTRAKYWDVQHQLGKLKEEK